MSKSRRRRAGARARPAAKPRRPREAVPLVTGIYRWLVFVLGIGAFAASAAAVGRVLPGDFWQWLGLTVLYCGAALLMVPVGKAVLNLGYMALFAVMVNMGPVDAMWLVLIATTVMTVRMRQPLRDYAFHIGQQNIAILSGLTAFAVVGGEVGMITLRQAGAALVAATLVFDAVNVSLVVANFTVGTQDKFAVEFVNMYWRRRQFTAVLYHSLALTSAVLYAHEGLGAAVLLAAVMLAMRGAFHLPQQLERHREEARRDGMTEVYNYRFLTEWRRGEGADLVARGVPFCFLFVDIDRLKVINDSRGHGTGDDVIRCVARSLRTVCRSDDPIIRYGGDEFLAVLRRTDSQGGLRVANRLLRVLTEEGRDEVSFSVSIGVASFPSDADSLDELFEAVDAAAYRGKRYRRHSVYTAAGRSLFA